MTSKNQKYWHAEKIKKYMKENGNYFIRNNERFREKLKMNKKQLACALKYLEKTGFLEPWNNKVYQKSNT